MYGLTVGPDRVNILPPFKNSLMAQFSPDTGGLATLPDFTVNPQLIIPINSNADYIPTFIPAQTPGSSASADDGAINSVPTVYSDSVPSAHPFNRVFSSDEIVNDSSSSELTKRITMTSTNGTSGGNSSKADVGAHEKKEESGNTNEATVAAVVVVAEEEEKRGMFGIFKKKPTDRNPFMKKKEGT
jgi:hypothetical protein